MNIETKSAIKEIKSEVQTAHYSADDIKNLIVSNLEQQGCIAELSDISFNTDWEKVSDEWGMNTHIVTVFTGADVKL